MKFKLLLFFLFTNSIVFSQTKIPDYEFEYTDHYGARDRFVIEFYLKNNSDDTLFIHRSVPLKYQMRINSSVPFEPEFYNMKFLTDVTFCEIPPYFEGSNGKPIKDETYFLAIPPQGQHQVNYYNSGTDQMICDEKIGAVKVKFEYDFDKRYLDKAFFAKEITEPGKLSKEKSESLYQLLQKSYQGKIESKEITIDLNNIPEGISMSSKKERALRRAKREFGIEIDEVFYPDYLKKFSGIKINVGDDFEESQLETMQENLMKSLGHASSFYSMVKQNDQVKWIVGSSGRDRIYHYDYQDILDSLNLAKADFLEKKENSEIKDYEIHSTYWHLQNVGATSSRFISKHVFLILKNPAGEFFATSHRNRIYPRSYLKLTQTDHGFEYIKKSYSSFTDDQKFTYEILKNGDLALAKSDAVEKGRMQYQGYLIRVE
ncbi:MAG: hypothetical protein AB8H03_05575 [Saprospiraceae bacterium]